MTENIPIPSAPFPVAPSESLQMSSSHLFQVFEPITLIYLSTDLSNCLSTDQPCVVEKRSKFTFRRPNLNTLVRFRPP